MSESVRSEEEEDEIYLATSGGGLGFDSYQDCQIDPMAFYTSNTVFGDEYPYQAADTTNIYTPNMGTTMQPLLPYQPSTFDTPISSGQVLPH